MHAMKKAVKYICRGVALDTEVWAALKKLRAEHGSYNKGLRQLLLKSTNGKGKATK